MSETQETSGHLLRQWRQHRRLSQLELALEAGISQRHLSFVESGRSRPSRDMVLHLAEQLDVPLRERNAILVAAGHAPHYPQRSLEAPALSAASTVIEQILNGHLPHPALAVNRHWELLASNSAVQVLLEGVAPHLLSGTVNVLRLSLHPDGLAPRILNLAEWRRHVLDRLAHEIDFSADPALFSLRKELEVLQAPAGSPRSRTGLVGESRIAVPLRLTGNAGEELTFLSTTTVFGTAVDVTLSEVTIEAFFPTDRATTDAMAEMTTKNH